jgi:hypothetical protein
MSTGASSTFTDYLVRELRVAGLKARIALNEIQFVGVALKGGLIDPNAALEHLAEVGALHLVEAST